MYREDKIRQINLLLKSIEGKKLIVWGTGVHTDNLLKHTDVMATNGVTFVDKKHFGKKYYGKDVFAPNYDILENSDYIVISSYKFQSEIYTQIEEMGLSDKVLLLYSQNDKGNFYDLPSKLSRGWFYEGGYANWSEASKSAIGYDEKSISRKVYESTKKVIRGEANYERDSVCFYDVNYNYRLLFILEKLSKNREKINVIDFGGALGSEYWRHRKIIIDEGLKINWNVIEQHNFVELGGQLDSDEVRFYESIEAFLQHDHRVDLFIFSSVLQYIENWKGILHSAIDTRAEFILIERQPVADSNIVCVEHVGNDIYNASYPANIICKKDLLTELLDAGYGIVSEHVSEVDGQFHYVEAQPFEYRGWIFKASVDG